MHPLLKKKQLSGAVVQLVRIPACHAVGREFESRPHRKKHPHGCFFVRRTFTSRVLSPKGHDYCVPQFPSLVRTAKNTLVGVFLCDGLSLREFLAPRGTIIAFRNFRVSSAPQKGVTMWLLFCVQRLFLSAMHGGLFMPHPARRSRVPRRTWLSSSGCRVSVS